MIDVGGPSPLQAGPRKYKEGWLTLSLTASQRAVLLWGLRLSFCLTSPQDGTVNCVKGTLSSRKWTLATLFISETEPKLG